MASFYIRDATESDLPKINNFLARVSFDVGVHILELYFRNSQRIWKVALNGNDEIVAFDSCHEMNFEHAKVRFGFEMFVREDFQGRGIVKQFGVVYGSAPIVGNSTAQSLIQISTFECFDMKLLGFAGKLSLDELGLDLERGIGEPSGVGESNEFGKPALGYGEPNKVGHPNELHLVAPNEFRPLDEDIRVSLLKEFEIDGLLAYDRSIFDCDRSQFMRAWCSNSDRPYSRTFVARNRTRVVGFAVIRRFSDFFSIMPLYADNDKIAKRILEEMSILFSEECEHEQIYVLFNAKNRTMMDFVHRHHFEQCDSEVREYSRGAQEIKKFIDDQRVYALCDYWPV